MANTIKLKRGSGSDPAASDLTQGEIAVRTDTGKLFTKKDDNSVVEISGSGGGGATDKIEEGNSSVEVIDTGTDGNVVVTLEGTERAKISSANNSTTALIHNYSAIVNTYSGIQFKTGGSTTSAVSFVKSLRRASSTAATSLAFETTNGSGTTAEKVRITEAGDVGIGVTSPSEKLQVSGTVLGTALSTGASGTGINVSTNTISGPATLTVDPAAVGDNTGTVIVAGNLQVDGTTTTVNSTVVSLDSKTLTVASGAADAAAANDSGLVVDGASASILYKSASDNFTFNKDVVLGVDLSVTGSSTLGTGTGNVVLQYNGSSRFTTTSWGAQIAGGTIQFLNSNIENLRGAANDTNSILLKNNTGTALEINHASSNSYIKNSVGDFIVENQGTERLKVDTAGIDITGNIVVSGTVDGRDVATDGTKLDGIAANATAYSDSSVDTHLNTSTASSGEVLSYNGSDYDWVAQSSGGSTDLSYTDATRVIASSTGTDATLPLMSSGNAGLVPASGGGTTSFLRADGTFTAFAASNPVALKLPIATSVTLPTSNTEGQVSNLFNTSAVFNSSNSVSWSFNASSITIPEDGIYCVSINVQVTSTGARAQNYFGFAVDGTAQQGRSSHSYVRNSSSINDAGCTLTELLDLDAGDVVTVIGRSEGSITTARTTDPVTPGSIEIHKVSNPQGPQGATGPAGPSDIPQNSQTSAYTLVAGDNGKHVNITTGGVTVPSGVFSAGNVVSIYNDSGSSQTITQGSGVTLRLAGSATTGNRTLAQYGLCSALCVGSNEFIISGAGLT